MVLRSKWLLIIFASTCSGRAERSTVVKAPEDKSIIVVEDAVVENQNNQQIKQSISANPEFLKHARTRIGKKSLIASAILSCRRKSFEFLLSAGGASEKLFIGDSIVELLGYTIEGLPDLQTVVNEFSKDDEAVQEAICQFENAQYFFEAVWSQNQNYLRLEVEDILTLLKKAVPRGTTDIVRILLSASRATKLQHADVEDLLNLAASRGFVQISTLLLNRLSQDIKKREQLWHSLLTEDATLTNFRMWQRQVPKVKAVFDKRKIRNYDLCCYEYEDAKLAIAKDFVLLSSMKESAQATPVNFILTAAVGLKFLKYWVQMFPAHATYVDAQGNTVAHLALGEMIGTKQIDFEAAITFVENLMMSNKNILKEKNSLGQTPIWIFRQNKLTKDVCLDKTVFEKHQKFCKALKTED